MSVKVENNKIEKDYGIYVFDDEKMKKYLPEEVYEKLNSTIFHGESLSIEVADIVADTLKKWAIDCGATHFAHWFQPMTGMTAEKLEAFIEITRDGTVITDLLGTELIKGEPDASSFPSGGLRATFEARGYTAWDCTSPAFIKEKTLYIPTVFYSYKGEVLDEKTPLIRSCSLVSKSAIKLLRLLGNNDSTFVTSNVGAEQEYFLVNKDLFEKRKDLIYTGRTLFGAEPAKNQESNDHYFGSIKPKIVSYMQELDTELWKLGIPAKTKHNEVAPAQHELAPLYTNVNISNDNNHIIMEMMKKIASKYNLVCLLNEKPFDKINGSGKHNNWSLSTDDGINVFAPGGEVEKNKIFLVFTAALIRSIDLYGDLLRASAASAGNDLRIGGFEAPSAIITIFLGDKITSVFEDIENGKEFSKKEIEKAEMNIGISSVPKFFKDTEDRNRTSSLAFTGNKFEFRMLGSSMSLAFCNIVLNTAMSESIEYICSEIKKTNGDDKSIYKIIGDVYKSHKRVVFNGDNYSDKWKKEAKKLGLLNLSNTYEALKAFEDEKNVNLFASNGILTKEEVISRVSVLRDKYIKTIKLEAKIMVEMTIQEILPSVYKYLTELASNMKVFLEVDPKVNIDSLRINFYALNDGADLAHKKTTELRELIKEIDNKGDKKDLFCSKDIKDKMQELRLIIDCLEKEVAKEYWPMPSYEDILYKI